MYVYIVYEWIVYTVKFYQCYTKYNNSWIWPFHVAEVRTELVTATHQSVLSQPPTQKSFRMGVQKKEQNEWIRNRAKFFLSFSFVPFHSFLYKRPLPPDLVSWLSSGGPCHTPWFRLGKDGLDFAEVLLGLQFGLRCVFIWEIILKFVVWEFFYCVLYFGWDACISFSFVCLAVLVNMGNLILY